MNEEKKTDLALDPDRAAYMIAWRDRYIERLQQRLTGREEENAMMSTLLFYGLFHAATEHEGERGGAMRADPHAGGGRAVGAVAVPHRERGGGLCGVLYPSQ